jgi:lysozyme family protein
MSEAFRAAVERTLQFEGSYVDDPADPGGATKYGISKRFLDGIGDNRHPRDLTIEDARQLYLKHFWEANGYDKIADPILAGKVFDLAVNMGPRQAHILLQRALRASSRPVAEDGKLGPLTLAAVNAAQPMCLLAALRSEAAGFYRTLAATKGMDRFLRGWVGRGYA